MTLALPAGGDVRSYGLVARGSLVLGDRARVRDAQGAPLDVYNVAAAPGAGPSTTVGTWDNSTGFATGDLVSHGSVFLRDRAKIGGDVITAGTITKQNQVVINGTQQAGAQLVAPLTLSFQQPLAANLTQPPVLVAVNTTRTLEPGAYSQVTAYAGATLVLKSGNYALSGLQLEPQSKLQLQVDATKGPVVLYVDNLLAWRGTTLPGATDGLLVVYKGTQSIRFEQKLAMAVVAPNATVTLATGGLTHAGSVYAKGISLDPDVRLNYMPFKYWDWVLPPKPIAECVYPAGAGTYMAAFGYENARGVDVSVPLGSTNFFTPSSARQVSVSTFKPGRHKKMAWVEMPSTGVTWTVNGQSAKVDLTSPSCDLREMAVFTEREGSERLFPPPSAAQGIPPAESTVFTENGLGAGRYFSIESSSDPSSSASGSSGVHVITQNLDLDTGVPGEPPTLSLPESGPLPSPHYYRVDAHGFAEKEGLNENASFGLGATIGSSVYPVEFIDYSRHGNAEGSKSFAGQVVGQGPLLVKFTEYDNHSRDDNLYFEGLIDDSAGTFSSERYGIINGQTLSLDPIVDMPIGSSSGITAHSREGKRFELTISVNRVELTAPAGTVKLCAYWPTQYWDNGEEAITGVEVPGTAVRGMPASFAKYFLTIVSAFEETHPTLPAAGEIEGDSSAYKYLDKDGCIPEVDALRIAQLAHFPGAPSGGHTDFFLKVLADYAIPTSDQGHFARYVVYSRADVEYEDLAVEGRTRKLPVWPPPPVNMTLHFRHFGGPSSTGSPSNWTLNADGLLVPPSLLEVTGLGFNQTTNMAGSVSRMLALLDEEGVVLPAGNYPVELGKIRDTSSSDTLDYSCRFVGDSHYSQGATVFTQTPRDPLPAEFVAAKMGVEMGSQLYPCDYERPVECRSCFEDEDCDQGIEEGVCRDGVCSLRLSEIAGENDCRRSCSAANPDCPGGQVCFEEVLVTEDADLPAERRAYPTRWCQEGGTCYCGWDAQAASKISNAHELGHLVQAGLMGDFQGGGYSFICPGTLEECEMFGNVVVENDGSGNPEYRWHDPPGTSPECKCDQVSAANKAHCLQSIELTDAAQSEGYGQFFASLMWNGSDWATDATDDKECWFTYYKEFLTDEDNDNDGEKDVLYPPVTRRCNERYAWREKHMCGMFDPSAPTTNPLEPSNMSTELDWMNFLMELKQTIGFTDLMSVYRKACHPENDPAKHPRVCAAGEDPTFNDCHIEGMSCSDMVLRRIREGFPVVVEVTKAQSGLPIYWRDAASSLKDPALPTAVFYETGGFYDGAVRIWGADSDEGRLARQLGNAHAVSDGTTPSP